MQSTLPQKSNTHMSSVKSICKDLLKSLCTYLLKFGIDKREKESIDSFFHIWQTVFLSENSILEKQYLDKPSSAKSSNKKNLYVVTCFSNREKFVLDLLTKCQNLSTMLLSVWRSIYLHRPNFIEKEFFRSEQGDIFFLYDGPYGHTSLKRNCEKINKMIEVTEYEGVALVSIRNLSFRTPIWSAVSNFSKIIPVRVELRFIPAMQIYTKDIEQMREETLPSKKNRYKPMSFVQTKDIENFLWMCPNCFGTKTLKARNTQSPELNCTKCNSTWSVDIGWMLRSTTPIIDQSLREIYAYEAIETTLRHIGSQPIQNKNRYTQSRTLCMENTAQVFLDTSSREMIAVGELYLQSDLLYVQSRSGRLWELPLSEIDCTRIWDADELILQSVEYRYCIRFISGNAFLWRYYIESWMVSKGTI